MVERRRAVFLDKDGTLVENVPYNIDPDSIRLARGAAEALGRFHRAGYSLVVVSNQSGVARGIFPEGALHVVTRRLADLFTECGVPLARFYYCPHHPHGSVPRYARQCRCRKPSPGMLLRASAELELDLARSWMLGDILDDVEAGRRAGCGTILVDTGGETEWHLTPSRHPDHVVPDIVEAASRILDWERNAQFKRPVRSMADATPRVSSAISIHHP